MSMDKSKPFGLILPKRQQKFQPKTQSVFESDSDDETQKKRTAIPQAKLSKRIIKEEILEDPSIYEYDSIYDDMKAQQVVKLAPKDNKPSRYIDTLLKAADKRKKEYERRVERKVQVEREKEGDKFKEKEAFVTSAYKRKMQEMEEEEERERRENELNDMMDVTKQKDLSGFYRHFLKQSVGEEKVPEFGERKAAYDKRLEEDKNIKVKEEPLSDSDKEKSRATRESNEKDKTDNIDQDSDIVSSSDEEVPKHDIQTSDNLKNKHDKKILEAEQDSAVLSSNDDVETSYEVKPKTNFKTLKTKLKSSFRKRKSSSSDSEEKEAYDAGLERHSKEVSNKKHSRSKQILSSSINDSDAENKQSQVVQKPLRMNDNESAGSSDSSIDNNESVSADEDVSRSKLDSVGKGNVAVNDEKKTKKIYIYAKRTVGQVFAAAQARYFQRMANRGD